jgi:nucleotide-binding universal stress UspA family protein
MPVIHSILHPTDLSETSQAAFRLACALARDYGAELIVLHVYPPPVNQAEAVDRGRDGDFENALWGKLRELAPDDKTVPVDHRLVQGDPAEVILNAARKCDLIVMGTHGRGLLRRAILGSVAEKVVREASCPVATIRPSARMPEDAVSTATAGQGAAGEPNLDLGWGE